MTENLHNHSHGAVSETVLLVEDEPVVREVVSVMLAEGGYCVVSARDGAGALAVLEERGAERVDVVVTDVVMPRMGGAQLAEALSERYPSVRVLYTSGYANDARVRRGLLASAPFLAKPFSADALRGKLREVLDGARL